MVEVPELSKKEIQKMASEMFVGILGGAGAFVEKRLGPEGVEEFGAESARHCTMEFRAKGIDNPLKLAMEWAVSGKNLFGGEVNVEGDAAKVELITERCALLEAAMGGMPTNKEEYCSGCIEGYHKGVAENLGLKLDAEYTEKGCRMRITK